MTARVSVMRSAVRIVTGLQNSDLVLRTLLQMHLSLDMTFFDSTFKTLKKTTWKRFRFYWWPTRRLHNSKYRCSKMRPAHSFCFLSDVLSPCHSVASYHISFVPPAQISTLPCTIHIFPFAAAEQVSFIFCDTAVGHYSGQKTFFQCFWLSESYQPWDTDTVAYDPWSMEDAWRTYTGHASIFLKFLAAIVELPPPLKSASGQYSVQDFPARPIWGTLLEWNIQNYRFRLSHVS